MQQSIPHAIYEYLETHDNVKPGEIANVFGVHPRTDRRYREAFKHGISSKFSGKRPISKNMQDLQEKELDFNEFIELARKLQDQAQSDDPMFNQDTITIDVDYPIGIMFMSCMHLGGRYTAYEEFAELWDRLLDVPEIYVVSLGDDIEGFISSFRDRAAVEKQLLSIPHQHKFLHSVLSPLNDDGRLICGVGSQHGSDWQKHATGRDTIKEMYLKDFGVPFFDGMAYIAFEIGKQVYRVGLAHEFRGNSMWNPSHPQMKALLTKYPNADIIAMGDRHAPAMQYVPAYPEEYAAGNRNSPNALLLQAGTAKTGLDDYTIKNWSAGQFEWPIVIFYPDRFQLEHTFSLDRAISMIENPI